MRIYTSQRCQLHQVPAGFDECPERLDEILGRLRAEGREIHEVDSHADARPPVLALHDPEYVERFERTVARGDGLFGSSDNPISAGSWEAAWAAVETSLAAADYVAEGAGHRAFAAVRPPGHHAERSLAMGFCFFGNVAVAAEHLLRAHGCEKVAIFDFDVHHGNGTQHLLEERSDIFFASTHQYPHYPGTGAASETGRGAGEGATLNLPLPAGTGDEGYAAAIRDSVIPALRKFEPEVLLLSAGFDAWKDDPLSSMGVTVQGFWDWGRWLAELADEVCQGRVLALLEGGYDRATLPSLVEAHLRGLEGREL